MVPETQHDTDSIAGDVLLDQIILMTHLMSQKHLQTPYTRHRFNVYTTSNNIVRRRIDVETTSCVYEECYT